MEGGINPVVLGNTGNDNGGLASGLLAGAALKGNGYSYDPNMGLNVTQMGGICDLRHDVQEARVDIKDAEANIRFGSKDSEANIRREIAKSECDLKETIHNQSLAIMNRFCDTDKSIMQNKAELLLAITKAEYEAKLAAQTVIKEVNANTNHAQERLEDKIAHGLEETREDLCALSKQLQSCCCEIEGIATATTASTNQTALVAAIVSALNVKN